MNSNKIKLKFQDGSSYQGFSFGYEGSTSGEVVFNTAMTGYPESLTDPSYKGQILVLTYPLIGNYGVPDNAAEDGILKYYESSKIHISALIISDYSHKYSHWNAKLSLSEWLKKNKVPGIYGIDTRALTKRIRQEGAMLGSVIYNNMETTLLDPNQENLVSQVSISEPKVYGDGRFRVLLIDCGVKNNIIRSLLERDCTVIRVPWNYDYTNENYDGLFISNGPGDPVKCETTIKHIRQSFEENMPIFGICLGNQLMGLASGAKTYKLKYGHRSHNQPVIKCGTKRAFITSQNHGFAIDNETLSKDWEPLFINLNDQTNEGMKHKTKPFFSTQFHPEAFGGPSDTMFLFDEFIELIKEWKKKIKTVLVLGSGALKIGEAGEFDYSGSQALKALREEGVKTILINPNIATVQNSEEIADKVYFLPVTPYFVEKVILKEKPDGILLAFGGQTALNCGTELHRAGTLKKYGVEVLGTPVDSIILTEDRELFANKLLEIDVKTPKSFAATTLQEAEKAADSLGFPIIIRAAFTLGGQGSGFCSNMDELRQMAEKAFSYSSQVLVEESLKGWKEVEYEVVRDKYDNCITVCNMENFDPLGIHTGESIVVAPSQTLTNNEYHKLRKIAIEIIRQVGVVGECNVQYALDPESEDYRVIEVNARLSRSSALASKATGYPLAFVAAKLALGYGLHELKNSVTKETTACFEPALDYVVCKIPRWDLNKFKGISRQIGSSMKSVGEVMSIGRSFEEAIQKGLRMIGQGMHGFVGNKDIEEESIEKELTEPTDMRIFLIAKAFSQNFSIDQIYELTKIDRWFLQKLENIWGLKTELEPFNKLEEVNPRLLLEAKKAGYSDFQLARIVLKPDDEFIEEAILKVREHRKKLGVVPVVKQIDTMAAEYPAQTNYLYLTYNGDENDIDFEKDQKSVIVLGSGAYRIGSSVEFDWSSVNALKTLKEEGYRSVVINFNPETVSTDYDISDRLYFEEITFERVMDIYELESPKGVIVSTGGQTANNLALRLHKEHLNILGTSAESIDNAENRHSFSKLLDEIKVDQPLWQELTSIDEVNAFIEKVGFPVLIRPSYVLSGAAMNVVSNKEELEHFTNLAVKVSKKYPVVVSEFIENAKEIEIDAVARKGEIVAYAITEHVEFAGVHSGDATMVFPPQKIYVETIRRIKRISRQIAEKLDISGPFNMQFLAKDNDIKVIECNLRASRSLPFVSKVLKTNFIGLATKIMLGQEVEKPSKSLFELDYIGVKAPQFSFNRLLKADPVLGVEMASTGEVGCIGDNYYEAILKAMLSVGYRIPEKNVLISSGPSRSKAELVNSCRALEETGYNLFATKGTHDYLATNGISSTVLYWPDDERKPNTLDYIRDKKIDLVINIPKDLSNDELDNDYTIRRSAVDYNVPLITNARLASAFILAFCKYDLDDIVIKSWDEYNPNM